MSQRPPLPLQHSVRIGKLIFNEDDFQTAAKIVDQTRGVEKGVSLLSKTFDLSVARAEHEFYFPSPRDLNNHLKDVAKTARRLARLLDLDCEPDSLIQFN